MRRSANVVVLMISAVFFTAFLAVAARAELHHVCPPGGGTSESPCEASDTLRISGTVMQICSIAIEPLPEALELNIVEGETGKHVANVAYSSNGAPFQILASSKNGGLLLNEQNLALSGIPWSFIWNDGAPVQLGTAAVTVMEVTDATGGVQELGAIKVSFSGVPDAAPGTWSDEATVTIQSL